MSDDPLLGTTLDGRYKITRLIGGGGMGAVYEAHHSGTGRRVAVKVISTGDVTKNEALVGRFQREARAAGSVDTEHIAQVLDTGRDEASGLPFMVMEYLTGEDVQQFLRRVGPIGTDLALRIAAQACIGLQKAHDAHVVHRDIKPANLFLARRDEGTVTVKVLDFGIAKIKMDQAQQTENDGLTRTGSMLGSPLYMSPEQARGHKTIDHRADIWSLGVVLYQLLAGRTPYEEIDALGELIIAICSQIPRPVQEFAPWVSPEVAAIVHGALRLDPPDRFQSAGAMLDAIKPLLPYGWAITQDLLVGIGEQERAQVAPRLSMVPRGFTLTPSAAANGFSATPVAAGSYGGTNDGVARSQQVIAQPSSKKLPMALGAGTLALGAIGFLAFKLLSPAPMPVPEAKVAEAVIEAPRPAPPPDPTPAPPVERKVKLVILPSDASVTVDGAASKASDGIIEISGALGSVHKVKLSVGTAEIEREIVVTENGAIPPKIELDAPKEAKAPTGGGSKNAPAAVPAVPGTPKPPPPKSPNIDRQFD